jgi:hypothetical protein
MNGRQASLVAAVLVILAGAGFAAFSIPMYAIKIGAGPGAGVFPFWVGLLLVAAGVAYFLESFKSQDVKPFLSLADGHWTWIWQTAVSLYVYIAAMQYVGFAVASFLFTVFHLRFIGAYGWTFALSFSLVVASVFAYVFEVLLYTPLPGGFLGF